ncbi:MAG: DNA repair protein RadA [Bacillota bacterium]|nr:DNA repair protein RadA [Bacillota bacterium]
MPEARSRYVCQSCGYEAPRWLGRCPQCGQWNSLVEEPLPVRSPPGRAWVAESAPPLAITAVEAQPRPRFPTGSAEMDRVLGGGVVPGSVVLIGGDPGIGKSTLLLQVSCAVSREAPALYISGEESVQQIRMRAERLGALSPQLLVMADTDLEGIVRRLGEVEPRLAVVDSIQTVYRAELASAPGSVSQVRECTAELLRVAKSSGVAIFVVGHVTKGGEIAGPRVLEHMVDTVLYLDGDRHHAYRVLRSQKNRFGSASEMGVFEMVESGLMDVPNPSGFFLAERPERVPGSVVTACLEGMRPLLVEVQALVSPTPFAVPRRMVAGVDAGRAVLMAAVLEKRLGMHLGNQDAYVKVAGGVKIEEPAVDLAVAVALASSFRDLPVRPGVAVAGEVGLAGEVRGIPRVGERLREAQRVGFTAFVLPVSSVRSLDRMGWQGKIRVEGVSGVGEALELVLG